MKAILSQRQLKIKERKTTGNQKTKNISDLFHKKKTLFDIWLLEDIRMLSGIDFVLDESDQLRALSHTRVMDYDEACIMHLTPGVVHNFPKAVGV